MPKTQGVWKMLREHSRFKRSSGDGPSGARAPKQSGEYASPVYIDKQDKDEEDGTARTNRTRPRSEDIVMGGSTDHPPHLLRRRSKTASKLTREIPTLSLTWSSSADPTKLPSCAQKEAKKKNRNLATTLKKLTVRDSSNETPERGTHHHHHHPSIMLMLMMVAGSLSARSRSTSPPASPRAGSVRYHSPLFQQLVSPRLSNSGTYLICLDPPR